MTRGITLSDNNDSTKRARVERKRHTAHMFELEQRFGLHLPLLDTCSQSTTSHPPRKETFQLGVFDIRSLGFFTLVHQFRQVKHCSCSNTLTSRFILKLFLHVHEFGQPGMLSFNWFIQEIDMVFAEWHHSNLFAVER